MSEPGVEGRGDGALPPASWNQTATAYPRDRALAELFEEQVDRAPHAIAVIDGARRMSYGELEQRANQVAARLRALDVAPGDRVGLCVERSAEMVIGLLGICKAGAAYVPLDPSYPAARLAMMLEDAAPKVLLGDQALADALTDALAAGQPARSPDGDDGGAGAPRPAAPQVVYLHAALPEAARQPVPGGAGDVAYVIYTSGTTGRPKGVVAPQRAVTRLVRHTNYVRLRASDVFLALSPLSFDAATFEIWGALLNGARLVVHRSRRFDAQEVIATIQREGVSVLWLTAALFDELTLHHLEGLRGLRYLLAGGDVLPTAAIGRALRGLPDTTLINGYGPTETTTFATAFRFPRDWSGTSAPIGRPLANTQVHILDEARRPVAIGATGELYIGGDGLALGYLNLPELTAQRFVANPFDDGATRLYRTGDRGRWLADGTIEFLGRNDQQVKLRGFRIELEEIEHALTGDPQIAQAVVVVREPTPGDKRLIAYVVAAGDVAPAPGEVQRRLAARLPEYMVPALVIAVPQLPVTPNGKVDRAALPAVDAAAWTQVTAAFVAPRGATEEELAALWRELLSLPRVGRDDDFFALGGHSLLVGRLAARIRATMRRETSLAALYRAPTLAAMAAHLEERQGGRDLPPAPPPLLGAHGAVEGPAPLSFPQERVWFLERVAPGNLAYQMQATLELVGPLDVAALRATLGELVARHSILRTAFQEIDGAPVQVVEAPYPVELPVVELAGGSIDDFRERAYAQIKVRIAKPYSLERGRLARWTLFRHSAERHLLLHEEHHLVHDGWSLSIFLDELKVIYEAFHRGAPSPLPPPPLQFADFARWQRRWLTGPVLTSFLEHWKRALASPSMPQLAPLELPTDRPRPPAFSFKGTSLRADFTPAEYARLRAAAKAHNVTLFTVMFSGFALLLSRYARQDGLVIGVGAANRRLAEAERLLGMMINTLPLRVDLEGDPTFAQLLAQVHATAIEAYAWADVPLDHLVDALALPRDPSRNPLFSTIFSFHDAAVPDLTFADVEARLRIEHNGSAKTDINIIVIPRAEQRVGRAASFDDDSLSIIWEYSTDLFDAATMQQMLDDYRGLLAAGLEKPRRPGSRLVLQSTQRWAEREAARPNGATATAAERFAAQVAAGPERVALRRGERKVSYGELARLVAEGAGATRTTTATGAAGLDGVIDAVAQRLHTDDAVAQRVPALIGEALRGADFALPGERVLQLAPPGSERGALELWGALLGGATLQLMSDEEWSALEEDRDGRSVAAALARYSAEAPLACVLPAPLAAALASRYGDSWRQVTSALVLGDEVAPERLAGAEPSGDARRLQFGAGSAELPLALLGPLPDQLRPIDGVAVRLADRHGVALPPGVIGEIEWGVPHAEGELELASGWRGRRLRDGVVQLRGRDGERGELNGFALELHETRAALLACDVVTEAHVELRDGELCAYLVTTNVEAARAQLAAQLPGYQVPTRYVALPALPLDRHGRVDRAALPAPSSRIARGSGVLDVADLAIDVADAARTATQQRVAEMCAGLLGLPTVELHTSFFLLGGRSLLATRLVALVNRELGVNLSVAVFLRQPTVAALAAAVDAALDAARGAALDAARSSSESDGLAPSARRNAAELLANLDRLSDAEVNDLLKEMG